MELLVSDGKAHKSSVPDVLLLISCFCLSGNKTEVYGMVHSYSKLFHEI